MSFTFLTWDNSQSDFCQSFCPCSDQLQSAEGQTEQRAEDGSPVLEDQGCHTTTARMQASQCRLWKGLAYPHTVSVVCSGVQGVWKHHSKYCYFSTLQHDLYTDLSLTQATASGLLLKITTTKKSILLTERNYESEKSNFMPYLYEIMYIMAQLYDWNS